MTQAVFLNGHFVPSEQAQISVMDRGFLFGDGVYEVIPVYGGRLFRLLHHLQRLNRSLELIRMTNPLTADQWQQHLETLVQQRPGEDQSVYLQVTRGPAAKRDHAIPAIVQPTLFAMSTPLAKPSAEMAEKGIAAITLEDIRWQYCHIKAITLLANVLLRQEAADQGATEAILLHQGQATEGAASNLFILQDGQLLTPPKSPLLLPGITRDLVLELAAANKIPYRETDIAVEQLQQADEIWLTSSTREVMPVTRLNQQVVSQGRPGPLWHKMNQLYQQYKADFAAGRAD